MIDMSTFGPTYDPAIDGERLHTQMDRIRDFMLAQTLFLTLDEIHLAIGDPPSSVSAQLRHLRKERFGSYVVLKQRRYADSGVWEYKVEAPNGQPQSRAQPTVARLQAMAASALIHLRAGRFVDAMTLIEEIATP